MTITLLQRRSTRCLMQVNITIQWPRETTANMLVYLAQNSNSANGLLASVRPGLLHISARTGNRHYWITFLAHLRSWDKVHSTEVSSQTSLCWWYNTNLILSLAARSKYKSIPFLVWFLGKLLYICPGPTHAVLFFSLLTWWPCCRASYCATGVNCQLAVTREPFSSPEPTILLACGRNRELWEQPFQACAIDADCVKPDGQNLVFSFVIAWFQTVKV